MIQREFQGILSAWHGLVEELSYGKTGLKPLRWGVCVGYPDLLEVGIKDALLDEGLHLGMSSYTKSRWTRFLRRYFRPDLSAWIHGSIKKLTKYSSRPFVASYSVNLNIDDVEARTGHNYGGCLSSLQIRVHPVPTVILYSRACQMDKIGFLDLCLIHLVAREIERNPAMKGRKIIGRWVVSLGFISAISQVYYTKRFKKPMKGHILERRIRGNRDRLPQDVSFGPLARLLKRNLQMKEFGEIPRSCPVSELSLEFTTNE
jgi:hypothetical protein